MMCCGKENMKKRYKFSTALVAAVLLAAVLAGAAFAAGMLGIFDFLKNSANPIVPLEGAEGMVATHLGVSENEWAALTVEEGVFDGQGVLLKCRIAPKDAEKYAMFNCFMQGAPEDVYILENAPAEVGEGSSAVYSDDGILRERITNMPGKQELLIDGEAVEIPTDRAVALEKGLPVFLNDGTLCYAGFDDPQVLGRRDGRETIGYWIDATVGDGMIEFSHSDAQEQADGSVVWWLSGMAGEVLDADQIEIRIDARLFEGDECGNEMGALEAISFTLPKLEGERLYELVPVGEARGERFEIVSGSAVFTKVRGYLVVNYTYEHENEFDMGIDFRAYDADGRGITMGSGIGAGAPDENGVLWNSTEMQTMDDVPERIWLEAVSCGENRTLGRVECRLVESAASAQ